MIIGIEPNDPIKEILEQYQINFNFFCLITLKFLLPRAKYSQIHRQSYFINHFYGMAELLFLNLQKRSPFEVQRFATDLKRKGNYQALDQSSVAIYAILSQRFASVEIVINYNSKSTDSTMDRKSPLWKHIGKEDRLKSSQSSFSSNYRPKKAFHLAFEDQAPSCSQSSSDLWKQLKCANGVSEYGQNKSQSIPFDQSNQISPMIITMDMGEVKPQSEEVLEAISFDSRSGEQIQDLNHILCSMYSNRKQSLDIISVKSRQISFPESTQNERIETKSQSASNPNRLHSQLKEVAQSLVAYKKEIKLYKHYLLSEMSGWEVRAINDCKRINEKIESYVSGLQCSCKQKQEIGFKLEDVSNKNRQLEMDMLELKRLLAAEKEAREAARREVSALQEKARAADRSIEEKRRQAEYDQSLILEARQKSKKLQSELNETKLENETLTAKMGKLKELIKQKEGKLDELDNQIVNLQKKIKELKILQEEASNNSRKWELQLKVQRQRYEKQAVQQKNEINKQKQEVSKLRQLLKNSENQLNLCEEYMSAGNRKMKEMEQDRQNLINKQKDAELKFYKKLQEYDKCIVELQTNIKDMNMNQHYKNNEINYKEMEIQRLREDLYVKELENQQRSAELEEVKKDYQYRMMLLQQKEDGYAQQTQKDRWQQRYYTNNINSQRSPERTRTMHSPSYREGPPIPPPRSFKRQHEIPVREAKSSSRQYLSKVKSESNLSIYGYGRGQIASNTDRSEGMRQNNWQITKLGSRINNLRKQLTKELGQMNYN